MNIDNIHISQCMCKLTAERSPWPLEVARRYGALKDWYVIDTIVLDDSIATWRAVLAQGDKDKVTNATHCCSPVYC